MKLSDVIARLESLTRYDIDIGTYSGEGQLEVEKHVGGDWTDIDEIFELINDIKKGL